MRSLICTFVVRIWHKQVFSWRRSYFSTEILVFNANKQTSISNVTTKIFAAGCIMIGHWFLCKMFFHQYLLSGSLCTLGPNELKNACLIPSAADVRDFALYCNKQTDREYEPPHDKTNKIDVRPAKTLIRLGWAKTQISLGISPVWSESSLCAQWCSMGR